MLENHPDRNSHLVESEKRKMGERAKIINRAYDILKDEKTREIYDRFGATEEADIEKIKEDFNDMGGSWYKGEWVRSMGGKY